MSLSPSIDQVYIPEVYNKPWDFGSPDSYISHTDDFGFITPEERKTIVEQIKQDHWTIIRAIGDSIVVKPYITPEKVGSIIVPGSKSYEDTFQTQIGQIIDIGPLAYSDKNRVGNRPWVKIGDWVQYSRIAGTLVFRDVNNNGSPIPFRIMNDGEGLTSIKSPTDWLMGIPRKIY